MRKENSTANGNNQMSTTGGFHLAEENNKQPYTAVVDAHTQATNGSLILPLKEDMLSAEFERQGPDLVVGTKDQSVLVTSYFQQEQSPALISEHGKRLTGATIEKLSGSVAPAQYAGPTPTSESIGTVERMEGIVRVKRADGSTAELKQGDPVYQNDVIETEGNGKIGIEFQDGSVFTLGNDARMTLDEFVYDPATGEGSSSVGVIKGMFKFVSGEIAANNPGEMEITTPVATLGIRGTTGGGQVLGEGQDNSFFLEPNADGTVGWIDVQTDGGVQSLNQPNMMVGIQTFDQAPPPPVFIPPSQLESEFNPVMTFSSDGKYEDRIIEQNNIENQPVEEQQAEQEAAPEEQEALAEEAADEEQPEETAAASEENTEEVTEEAASEESTATEETQEAGSDSEEIVAAGDEPIINDGTVQTDENGVPVDGDGVIDGELQDFAGEGDGVIDGELQDFAEESEETPNADMLTKDQNGAMENPDENVEMQTFSGNENFDGQQTKETLEPQLNTNNDFGRDAEVSGFQSTAIDATKGASDMPVTGTSSGTTSGTNTTTNQTATQTTQTTIIRQDSNTLNDPAITQDDDFAREQAQLEAEIQERIANDPTYDPRLDPDTPFFNPDLATDPNYDPRFDPTSPQFDAALATDPNYDPRFDPNSPQYDPVLASDPFYDPRLDPASPLYDPVLASDPNYDPRLDPNSPQFDPDFADQVAADGNDDPNANNDDNDNTNTTGDDGNTPGSTAGITAAMQVGADNITGTGQDDIVTIASPGALEAGDAINLQGGKDAIVLEGAGNHNFLGTNTTGVDVIQVTSSGTHVILSNQLVDTADNGRLVVDNLGNNITLNTEFVMDDNQIVVVSGDGQVMLSGGASSMGSGAQIVHVDDNTNGFVNANGGGANMDAEIFGGMGDDTLVGRDGANHNLLFGGGGDDSLVGGSGATTHNDLFAGAGVDRLTGGGSGAENYFHFMRLSDGTTTSNATAGVDVITNFTAATDKIIVDWNGAAMTGTHNAGTNITTLSDGVTTIKLEGGDFSGLDMNATNLLTSNVIYADKIADWDEILDNITGDFSTTGASKAIYAMGGDLGNWMQGGTYGDMLFGGDGMDDIYGGAGNDTIEGFDDDDALYGEDGNDQLFGGWGADTLTGGAGADTLDGGLGPDTYVYDAVGDSDMVNFDVIHGFDPHKDIIDLSSLGTFNLLLSGGGEGSLGAAGLDISFAYSAGGTNLFIDTDNGGAGDMQIRLEGYTGPIVSSFFDGAVQDSHLLSWSNDDIAGDNAVPNTFYAEYADQLYYTDQLEGSTSAADIIKVKSGGYASIGAGTLGTGANQIEKIWITGENPAMIYDFTFEGATNYAVQIDGSLIAAGGNLHVNAATNTGNMTIEGGLGVDTIIGGSGDDVIIASEAGDSVTFNGGDDTLKLEAGYTGALGGGRMNIIDFTQGEDVIDVTALGAFDFIGMTGFDGSANQIRFLDIAGSTVAQFNFSGDTTPDFEISLGSIMTLTAADFMGAGTPSTTSFTTGTADALVGTGGNDTYTAPTANDIQTGDNISDAGGTDVLDIQAGGTAVFGTYITAVETINLADGGGNYILDFNTNTVNWGGRIDASTLATGGDNVDVLAENSAQNIQVTTGVGADVIKTGSGDDVINTGTGNDTVHSSEGADQITLGAGFDMVKMQAAYMGATGVGNRMVIHDFTQGDDQIDLGALGAFDFVGDGSFTGGGQESVRYSHVASSTIIEVDMDGDGALDFEIEVTNGNLMLDDLDFIGATAVSPLSFSATASDNLIGTIGDDTFTATIAYDIQAGDSITTNGGNDTIHILSGGTAMFDTYVNDIQVINLDDNGSYILDFETNSADFTGIIDASVLTGGNQVTLNALNSTGLTANTGAGDDMLRTGVGADIINAGDGHDSINAGGGNDMVDGMMGDDTIYGGMGDDLIDAGAGTFDHLYGEDGDDVLQTPNFIVGQDELYDGGAGFDTLKLMNDGMPATTTIDFSQINTGVNTYVNNMEVIDLRDDSWQLNGLSAAVVNNMVDNGPALGNLHDAVGITGISGQTPLNGYFGVIITGEADDTVDLTSLGWTDSATDVTWDDGSGGGAQNYSVYTNGSNALVINDAINVTQ